MAENSFDWFRCAQSTKKRFPKVASSMQIVCYPSQDAKVFRAQFHQVRGTGTVSGQGGQRFLEKIRREFAHPGVQFAHPGFNSMGGQNPPVGS